MRREKWTLQNMPDLTGKTFIVTGAFMFSNSE